jgi:hypothetical protein
VILADEDFRLGGRLNAETLEVDGVAGSAWAEAAAAELAAMPDVRLMPRTCVYGAYDHGVFGALERTGDHLAEAGGKPRQVLWRIYARRSLLAAGATERAIAFGDNDRPGVMLAGAVRAFVNRWGVRPGARVAVFTNNADGWRTARDLLARGVGLSAVIDTRDRERPLLDASVPVYATITRTSFATPTSSPSQSLRLLGGPVTELATRCGRSTPAPMRREPVGRVGLCSLRMGRMCRGQTMPAATTSAKPLSLKPSARSWSTNRAGRRPPVSTSSSAPGSTLSTSKT